MKKINREEYEVLKGLDGNLKMLGRNSSGWLIATRENPIKGEDTWDHVEIKKTFTGRQDSLFQFIQWEDEEPYNIKKLIKEYEDSKEYKDSLVIEYFMDKENESEETEVKDNEWAIKEIEGLETESSQYYPHDEMIEKEIVISILNQLDEPEVLSQEEEQTPETVADVMVDFSKSLERLKEVLGMELKD